MGIFGRTMNARRLDPLKSVDFSSAPALELSVSETIERWPATRAILAARGLDLCCGGGASCWDGGPRAWRRSRGAAGGASRRGEVEPAMSLEALDLRGLTPPEPMVRIFSALAALGEGEELVAILPHAPVPLFALLEERGASWETVADEPGRFVLRVRRTRGLRAG